MSPRRKRGLVATLMGARRRAGVGLAAGAVAVWWGGADLGLHWVPLLAGAGALLGCWGAGPKDGPWGEACVLLGLGGALASHRESWIEEPEATLLLLGAAAGLAAAALLRTRGFAVGLGGMATATGAFALAHLLRDDLSLVREPAFWAVVVAVWAAVHLLEIRLAR